MVVVGRITDTTIFKHEDNEATTDTLANVEASRPNTNVGGEELSFSSIGGLKKEIQSVQEIVDLAIVNPHIFQEFGKSCILFLFKLLHAVSVYRARWDQD